MYREYATQYDTSCVVIEDGDTPEEVIEYAEYIGAKTFEGDSEVLVIRFPDRPAECYTERALRDSMKE